MLTQYDIHTTVAIAGIKRKPLTQRQQDMLMELVCLVRDKVFDERQTSIGEWLSPKREQVMDDVGMGRAEAETINSAMPINAISMAQAEMESTNNYMAEKRRLNKAYGKMIGVTAPRQLVLEPVEGEPGYGVRVNFLEAKL